MVGGIQGLLVGDKGYLSGELKADLDAVGFRLETALRSNMQESRPAALVQLLQRLRRLVETVIGQLSGRFHIEKVWAQDMWHFTSRLNRKLLAHTVCRWLNRHTPNPLQFEGLIRS